MQNNKLILPVAIIVAGLLIGTAIIYTGKAPAKQNTEQASNTTSKVVNMKPITADDHILGNPDAKLLMVEYSDTECPYCKTFAGTMEKIMDTYSKDGTVAWVYRQFPIPSLHPLAPKEAEATECVNKLGGNAKFWQYLEKIYQVTPSNNKLDPAQLPIIAASFGIDKKAFQACLDNGTFTDKIQADYQDATATGAQGTPYTIIISKKPVSDTTAKQISDMFTAAALQYKLAPDQLGFVASDNKIVLNGNLPYEFIQQIIAALVS